MSSLSVGFLIIGNEVLAGRTIEKNLAILAKLLNHQGLRLKEARVVADVKSAIVQAVNDLRYRYDYVFTSGGIGPTHDDITTESLGMAFNLAIQENPLVLQQLQNMYAKRQLPLTAARRRMARMPTSAKIIDSDFGGAPAYCVNNVFVCAGVPSIFEMMATGAIKTLPRGEILTTSILRVWCAESEFALDLANIANDFTEVEIGSYPRQEGGNLVCHITFSATGEARLKEAQQTFIDYLQVAQVPYEHVPNQAPI